MTNPARKSRAVLWWSLALAFLLLGTLSYWRAVLPLMRTRAAVRSVARAAADEHMGGLPHTLMIPGEAAGQAVADMGGPRRALRGIVATDHLWACLRPEHFHLVAPEILVACGSEVVPDLCDLIEENDRSFPMAIAALGRIGDTRAEPVLLKLLESPGCPREAYEALGLLRSRGAVDGLMAAVASDPDEERRGVAAIALGRIGEGRAAPVLAEAFLATRNINIRGSIRRGLEGIGQPALAPLQERLAREDDPAYRDMIEDVICSVRRASSSSPDVAETPAVPVQ